MAKKRTHHKKQMTIPLAIVAGFIPVGVGLWNRRSDPSAMGDYLKAGFTGLDSSNHFNFANLRQGALPVMAGFFAHQIASRVGINKAIARAGIPFVRI